MNTSEMHRIFNKGRQLRIPVGLIEFYIGLKHNYPLCCIINFVLDCHILPERISRCKKDRGYRDQAWFGIKDREDYSLCFIHAFFLVQRRKNP